MLVLNIWVNALFAKMPIDLLFVVLVALGPMLRASRLAARAQAQEASTPQPFGLAQLPG